MAEPVMEEGLLMDASAGEVSAFVGEGRSFIPDFVLTFPRKVDRDDSVPMFSADELKNLFEHMRMDMHASGSDRRRLSVGSGDDQRRPSAGCGGDQGEVPKHPMYPACVELGKKVAADGKKVDRDEVQNAILRDLVQHLHKWGCTTTAFMSCDYDELFVLVSVGDPTRAAQDDKDACAIAQHSQLRLQTVFGEKNIEKLKMKQELHHGEEMYYPFSTHVSEDATMVLGIGESGSYDLYRKYSEGIAGTHGSILRTVDRYRILKSLVLDSFFCLNQVRAYGVINGYYIPHKLSKLEEFRSGKGQGVEDWDTAHKPWANFKCSTIFGGLRTRVGEGQPHSEIRDYFGERIAFYFMWLGYTARFTALLIPVSVFMSALYSLVNVLLDSHQVFEATQWVIEVRAASHLFSAAFFNVSFAVYLKFWTRIQAYYAELWDTTAIMASTHSHDRTGYRGKLTADPLNMRHRRKEYPWIKARGVVLVSQAITILFTLLVVLTVAGVYRLETAIPSMLGVSETTAMVIISLIFAVQILVYQLIWDRVSYHLVEISNPRTEEDEKNMAVQFLFPFSIVSTYSNIVFHAFYKTWNVSCVTEDCMKIMRPAMFQVVIPAVFMQLVSLVRPYVQHRYSLYSEARKQQHNVCRSFIEIQGKSLSFDLAALNKDMNLMMTLLGYAILFGFVAPGILFVVSLAFWLKIRIDAFKLCSVYQRAHSSFAGVSGIGAWNSMLVAISELGRWTSLAIPIFNLKYFQEDAKYSAMVSTMNQIKTIGDKDIVCTAQGAEGLTFFQKVSLLLICKLGVDVVCKLIDFSISDVSSETILLRQKREAVEMRMAFHLMASKLQSRPSDPSRRDSGSSHSQQSHSQPAVPGTPTHMGINTISLINTFSFRLPQSFFQLGRLVSPRTRLARLANAVQLSPRTADEVQDQGSHRPPANAVQLSPRTADEVQEEDEEGDEAVDKPIYERVERDKPTCAWVELATEGSLPRLDSSHRAWGCMDNGDFAPPLELRTYYGN